MPGNEREHDQASVTESATGSGAAPKPGTPRRRRLKWIFRIVTAGIIVWLLLAYVILPTVWRHYEHHRVLETAPKTTLTAQGIPGDALNVALIGTDLQLIRAMLGSGWDAADPVTLKSSIGIARSVLRDKPYNEAPVSPLFVFGRKQDFAFEKPAGKSASHRHHVRFWKAPDYGRGDVPLWIGAVTYDRSVGLSHRTGQITHHIGPDIDAERDGLFEDLSKAGWLTEEFQVTGVGATLFGHNGGGDRYYTDGELTIGLIASDPRPGVSLTRRDNPTPVRIKEQLWSVVRPVMQSLPGQ